MAYMHRVAENRERSRFGWELRMSGNLRISPFPMFLQFLGERGPEIRQHFNQIEFHWFSSYPLRGFKRYRKQKKIPWKLPCENSESVWEFHQNATSLPRFCRILLKNNYFLKIFELFLKFLALFSGFPKFPRFPKVGNLVLLHETFFSVKVIWTLWFSGFPKSKSAPVFLQWSVSVEILSLKKTTFYVLAVLTFF